MANNENRRISNLIKLGVFMILLSAFIFSTTNWSSMNGILKFLFLIVLGIIFYVLSIFTNKKLNLKISSLVYWFLSIIFFYFSYVSLGYFKLLGNWYSFFGDGAKLFISNVFLILGILLIISHKKINKDLFLFLAWNTMYLSLLVLLSFFKINLIYGLIIINVIAISFNFINIKDQYLQTLKSNNKFLEYILILIFLFLSINSYKIESIVFSIISLISLFIINYKVDKDLTFFDFIIPFITFILIIKNVLLFNFDIEFNFLLFVILNSIVVIICKLLFNKNTNLMNSIYINNFIYGVISGIVLLITNRIYFLVVATILLIINIHNSLAKTNEIEKHIEPYKVMLFLISIYAYITFKTWINIEILLIVSLFVSLFLSYISKDKTNQSLYYIIAIVTMVTMTILMDNGDFSLKLSLILSLISGSVLLAVINKKNAFNYQIFNYIFYIFLIITTLNSFNSIVIYSIVSIFLILLLSLIKIDDNKTSLKISLVALIIPLYNLVRYGIDIENYKIIISLYLILLAFIFDKIIQVNNKVAKVSILYIIAIVELFYEPLLSIIIMGILLILGIIYFYNKKEYKGLYIFSIIALIYTIVCELESFWRSIPLWLYLFIGGIVIILLVTKIELKKGNSNNPKKEIDVLNDISEDKNIALNTNYCPNCGTKLLPPKKYCPNCGKKVS